MIDFDENYDHSIFLEQSDCDSAMEHIQSILADAIGAPKIPKVQFQDVGGKIIYFKSRRHFVIIFFCM